MEKEVLDIIMQMIYNDKIDEMYEKRSMKIDFPITVPTEINFKVLTDFNANYFDKYQYILLNNALVYALKHNNKDYLLFIKEHINNLKNYLKNEMMFRIKTIELGYKNLINKFYLNNYKDKDIINKNKNLFKKINEISVKKETINQVYKNILFNLINNTYDKKPELLNQILSTNEFDKHIIELSNGIIDKNDINHFKNIIIRLILGDTFLHIVSNYMDEEYNDDSDNLYYKEDYDDKYENEQDYDDKDLDEFEKEIDMKILKHIEICVNNNIYVLPNDEDLRNDIISYFLIYNTYTDDNTRKFDIETIEQDKEKKLVLKKINPLYKLDAIDLNDL